MKYAKWAVMALSLLGWAYWLVVYAWPVTVFYFDLLYARQGSFAWYSLGFTLTVLLWVYYAATANLQRAIKEERAPMLMQVLGYTLVLPPMLFLDWLCNVTVFTVLFRDWPRGPWELVTGRLKRYVYEDEYADSKRQRGAKVFALILDELDMTRKHV